MRNTRRRSRWSAALLTSVTLALAGTVASQAQVVTGEMQAIQHFPYAGVAAHFTISDFAAGGISMFGGEVVIFSTDLPGRSPDEDGLTYPHVLTNPGSHLRLGEVTGMSVWSRYSTPQDEGLAIAMALWLVDNYFESYFLAPPSEANERQYAFQNVLWEIFGDGGTVAGLDFSTGNIVRTRFAPGGSMPSPVLWGHMTTLIAAVNQSGVTTGYQSPNEVRAVLDTRPGYQDYLLVSTVWIPEPGVLMLAAAATICAILRRRRAAG